MSVLPRAFPVVDAYAHCGLTKYEPIQVVRAVMAAAGVDRIVLVQHLGEYDNAYLGGIVRGDPEHVAAACLVDDEAPDARETLARWAATGDFGGVRLTDHSFEVAPELAVAAVDLGLIIVLYPQRSAPKMLPALQSLFEARPEARLVITHLGVPSPNDVPDFERFAPVLALAKYPGLYFQVSGLGMRAFEYPHEPVYPLLRQAYEAFGPQRLLWGSNYPPVGDIAAYCAQLDLLVDGRLPFPAESVPAIAGGNSLRLWWGE